MVNANCLEQVVLATDVKCHVPADLSGLVFFSTTDMSTSCVQFSLSLFAELRTTTGSLDMPVFSSLCKDYPSLTPLKDQLLEHKFITEYL
jgi:hypothetical protein